MKNSLCETLRVMQSDSSILIGQTWLKPLIFSAAPRWESFTVYTSTGSSLHLPLIALTADLPQMFTVPTPSPADDMELLWQSANATHCCLVSVLSPRGRRLARPQAVTAGNSHMRSAEVTTAPPSPPRVSPRHPPDKLTETLDVFKPWLSRVANWIDVD